MILVLKALLAAMHGSVIRGNQAQPQIVPSGNPQRDLGEQAGEVLVAEPAGNVDGHDASCGAG
jgi:hypothetical protein